MTLAIIIGVIILIAIIIIVQYNSLVKLKQRTKNAVSQIDIQLQRRFDLIPNLIETVKGYAKHEEEVLERIAEIRASYVTAQTMDEKLNAENEMKKSLKSVMAVAEEYPELKANENFLALQEELKETETKVAFSRQFYSDIVTMYNTKLEVFPSNLFAKMFGFKEEALFQVENESAKDSVKVQF